MQTFDEFGWGRRWRVLFYFGLPLHSAWTRDLLPNPQRFLPFFAAGFFAAGLEGLAWAFLTGFAGGFGLGFGFAALTGAGFFAGAFAADF
jgi:hypothetical protein